MVGGAGCGLGRRNHSTSIGTPSSRTARPASDRTRDARPSAATVSSAATSSTPSGVLAITPRTRPRSQRSPVTSASITRWKVGKRRASAARKSRKSHCGISPRKAYGSRSVEKSTRVIR